MVAYLFKLLLKTPVLLGSKVRGAVGLTAWRWL